jgi:zinc protease
MPSTLKHLCIVLFALTLAGCSRGEKTSSIEEYILPNGMTVVLESQHATPVVAVQVWVHVGSKDETDQTRGLAHIQEHMLFQGTKRYGPGEIFRTVEAAGGEFNAFTDQDVTVYHITMPAEGAATALQILASMMGEATIEEDALAKELEVVLEEFRRGEDNPGHVLAKAVEGTAYTEHPYKHPIIGYWETIEHTTRDDVLRFYHDWYVPENMTLVVVGDIATEAVKQEIERTFGALSARESPKRFVPPDPPQEGLRTVLAQGPFANAALLLAFRNTALTD